MEWRSISLSDNFKFCLETMVASILQKMASQGLLMNAVLKKVTEAARKTSQTEAAVNTFRETIENVKSKIESGGSDKTKQSDASNLMLTLGKKLNANAESLRKIQDQLQLMQKDDEENKAESFEENPEKPVAPSKVVLDKNLWSKEDLELSSFLHSNMGRNVKQLLELMENPDKTEWATLEDWWTAQKSRWNDSKQNKHGLLTMFRAFSWWAAQFEHVLLAMLTNFMVNPFAISLQELCHQAAFLRNALHSLGFISGGEAKVKWAEPFIALSECLNQVSWDFLVVKY